MFVSTEFGLYAVKDVSSAFIQMIQLVHAFDVLQLFLCLIYADILESTFISSHDS